jgi:hypothetical protein
MATFNFSKLKEKSKEFNQDLTAVQYFVILINDQKYPLETLFEETTLTLKVNSGNKTILEVAINIENGIVKSKFIVSKGIETLDSVTSAIKSLYNDVVSNCKESQLLNNYYGIDSLVSLLIFGAGFGGVKWNNDSKCQDIEFRFNQPSLYFSLTRIKEWLECHIDQVRTKYWLETQEFLHSFYIDQGLITYLEDETKLTEEDIEKVINNIDLTAVHKLDQENILLGNYSLLSEEAIKLVDDILSNKVVDKVVENVVATEVEQIIKENRNRDVKFIQSLIKKAGFSMTLKSIKEIVKGINK